MMQSPKVHADHLRAEIEYLLAQYPELKDDEDLRADMLEGETELFTILTALHRYREDSKALIEGSQARLEELAARKKRLGTRMDFLRQLMQSLLASSELRKVELPEVTLSITNRPQALIGPDDADGLPDELVRIRREPDRPKIKEALQAGRDVPGFVLNNAPPGLTVRVK